MTVKTEAAIQSDIGLIRTLGRVFLDHLRKCVQQRVAILFSKFRMPRVLELPINRNNIATVDRSEFSCSDDPAACFVIIAQIDHPQILKDGFQCKKLILKVKLLCKLNIYCIGVWAHNPSFLL